MEYRRIGVGEEKGEVEGRREGEEKGRRGVKEGQGR